MEKLYNPMNNKFLLLREWLLIRIISYKFHVLKILNEFA